MDWSNRYKEMKRGLRLTNKKVADITGNTPGSTGVMTRSKSDFPRWAKLAVVVYETMKNKGDE